MFVCFLNAEFGLFCWICCLWIDYLPLPEVPPRWILNYSTKSHHSIYDLPNCIILLCSIQLKKNPYMHCNILITAWDTKKKIHDICLQWVYTLVGVISKLQITLDRVGVVKEADGKNCRLWSQHASMKILALPHNIFVALEILLFWFLYKADGWVFIWRKLKR